MLNTHQSTAIIWEDMYKVYICVCASMYKASANESAIYVYKNSQNSNVHNHRENII